MSLHNTRRPAALLLAALLLALSACTPGGPSASGTPPVSETPTASETPPASETPSPSGGEDEPSPSVSGSGSPAPSQTPTESASPSPSAPPETRSPAQDPLPTGSGLVEEGGSVDNTWFSDAVFIGDSRTDGLRLYSGIRGATFLCHTGLSVFTVGSNACIDLDGAKVTVMDALAAQQWVTKVYLMLGINELGYPASSFKDTYTKVVEQIKELQPDAVIYLQTLIPINEPIAYEHGTSAAINNEKLRQFNDVIAEVAQEQEVFLVDVDRPFWSAEGCLDAANTGDGVHLTKTGYIAWLDYLKTHTGLSVFSKPADPPEESPVPSGEPSAQPEESLAVPANTGAAPVPTAV